MGSSFTTNLGLENPAYLSQNNTWGTTENTARTMLDSAIAGRSNWTLSGATFTITVPNGTVSSPSAIAPVWLFGGTPGVTCTVTFAPNTAQRFVFVFNNTPNTIIFTQGSGTTATVLSGAANIVFFDGTGAGANAALFATAPTAAPGSVTNPSYSFTGYPDVGLYVPGVHTLGIAANGVEMAQFAATGAGPTGLNTLGVTVGTPIGNAFSNVNMFGGGWAGPAVPSGYCFLYFDESTSLVYAKYRDSAGNPQQAVVGAYTPQNVATYAGANPPVINNSDYWLRVNEGLTELDFYYKDSGGASHGPFPLGGYGPNNLAAYVGAAPPTANSSNMWFQVNEAKTELDFYYKDSGGGSHGPFPVASYGPGNLATYAGAAPATINNRNNYFTTDESTGNLNWYYKNSSGASFGPTVIGNYSGGSSWINTFVPTFADSAFQWSTVGSIKCGYQQVGKTVAIQLLMEVTKTSGGVSGTFTISLPVPAYTGAGSFAQTISLLPANPASLTGTQALVSGANLTMTYSAVGGIVTAFVSFNGVYQSN